MGAGGRYKLRIHGVGRAGTSTVFPQAVFALCDSTKTLRCLVPASRAGRFKNEKQTRKKAMKIRRGPKIISCCSLGNTAQFPPDGLSTAPAAAARHLRCQNAR